MKEFYHYCYSYRCWELSSSCLFGSLSYELMNGRRHEKPSPGEPLHVFDGDGTGEWLLIADDWSYVKVLSENKTIPTPEYAAFFKKHRHHKFTQIEFDVFGYTFWCDDGDVVKLAEKDTPHFRRNQTAITKGTTLMPNWKDIEVFGAAPAAPSQPSVNIPVPKQTPPPPAQLHSPATHAEPADSLLSQIKARTDLRFYKELRDERTLSDVLQVVDPRDYELDEIEGIYIGSREAWELLEKYADEVGYSCVTDAFDYFPGPGYYTLDPGYYTIDDEDYWYNVNDRINDEKRILESVRRADDEAAERPYHAGR